MKIKRVLKTNQRKKQLARQHRKISLRRQAHFSRASIALLN